MNKDELTKELKGIMDSAKGVNLSAPEKTDIKKKLIDYAESHPYVKTKISIFEIFSYRSFYLMPALAIVLIISGGTSFFAANSLPGDMLYPVKINLNENVESIFAISPESKAEVNLRQVEERLDEAEVLDLTNNLTEVKSEQIQNNFSKQIETLSKNIEESKKAQNEELARKTNDEFYKKIGDHREIFEEISVAASNSPMLSEFYSSNNHGRNKAEKAEPDDARLALKSLQLYEDKPEPSTTTMIAATMSMEVSDVSTSSEVSNLPLYSFKDVKKHKKISDCWTIVNKGVYNITNLIKKYPVGSSLFKSMCGSDSTKKFNTDSKGNFMVSGKLEEYKIGTVK